MTTLAAARRWAHEWERAWREHDVAAVAALYADRASFHSHPFRDPQAPSAYAEWAFESEQPGAEVHFDEPFVTGDGRSIVEWQAVVLEQNDAETTLAGVSLLRFDHEGLVIEQRDYWAQASGRRAPFRRP
jgi:hypothetical protein